MFQKLLNIQELNVNQVNLTGTSALHQAIWQRSIEKLELLLQRGRKASYCNEHKPFHTAHKGVEEQPSSTFLADIHGDQTSNRTVCVTSTYPYLTFSFMLRFPNHLQRLYNTY